MDTTPELRVGDEDRTAVDRRLQAAVGEGRLGLAEYDERAAALWQARTRSDLDVLTADLPAAAPAPAPAARRGRTRRVLAVMSEDVLTGPVATGGRVSGTSVMGRAVVDLRRTDLPAHVTVRAVAVMGETSVLVPRGATVQLSGGSLMGSRGVSVDPPDAGAPVVTVRALSVMGDVRVSHGASDVAVPGPRLPDRPHAPPSRHRHRRGLRRLVPIVVAAAAVYGVTQVARADDHAIFGSGTHVVDSGSVRVGVLFGSYQVVVPDGARVEVDSGMVFGSVDCADACRFGNPGPVIRVKGSGAFGSVEVRTQSEQRAGGSD